jgi:aspartokinase/homoserine dehydrogenase 1
MKVLKFGGTSVANSSSIANVMSIVQQEEQCTVVVSALGGVTDLLLQTMEEAAQNNENYTTVFPLLEERHLEIIKGFIPVKSVSHLRCQPCPHANSTSCRSLAPSVGLRER